MILQQLTDLQSRRFVWSCQEQLIRKNHRDRDAGSFSVPAGVLQPLCYTHTTTTPRYRYRKWVTLVYDTYNIFYPLHFGKRSCLLHLQMAG